MNTTFLLSMSREKQKWKHFLLMEQQLQLLVPAPFPTSSFKDKNKETDDAHYGKKNGTSIILPLIYQLTLCSSEILRFIGFNKLYHTRKLRQMNCQ